MHNESHETAPSRAIAQVANELVLAASRLQLWQENADRAAAAMEARWAANRRARSMAIEQPAHAHPPAGGWQMVGSRSGHDGERK